MASDTVSLPLRLPLPLPLPLPLTSLHGLALLAPVLTLATEDGVPPGPGLLLDLGTTSAPRTVARTVVD